MTLPLPVGVGGPKRGDLISSPWLPGHPLLEVTQAWGQTDYAGEPPEDRQGQHYAHWHAGIDLGAPCGTHVVIPHQLQPAGFAPTTPEAKLGVRAVDNPGGYGTALVINIPSLKVDVWLGHLAQRLVASQPGQQATVRPGQDVAVTNNTGNSTGCHLHFEVRPEGGKYGSDVDPARLLSAGEMEALAPLNPLDQFSKAILGAEQEAQKALLAGGQVVLGSALMLGGLLVAARALSGGSLPPITPQGAARRLVSTRRTPVAGARPVRPPVTVAPTQQPGAGVLAKIASGADPRTFTRAEAAYASANPEAVAGALRSAGGPRLRQV